MRRLMVVIALALVAAGCGDDSSGDGEGQATTTTVATTTTTEATTTTSLPPSTTSPPVTTTSEQPAAPRVQFPEPFCSSILPDAEVIALAGGGEIFDTSLHSETFQSCSWGVYNGAAVSWVVVDVDDLGVFTLEEYFDSPGSYGPASDVVPIEEDGPGDERFAIRGGYYVRVGDWMVYVELDPYPGGEVTRQQHWDLAQLVIDRIGLG